MAPVPVTPDRVKSDNKSDCAELVLGLFLFLNLLWKVRRKDDEKRGKSRKGRSRYVPVQTSQFQKSFVCSNVQETTKIKLREKRK